MSECVRAVYSLTDNFHPPLGRCSFIIVLESNHHKSLNLFYFVFIVRSDNTGCEERAKGVLVHCSPELRDPATLFDRDLTP